VIRGIRVILCVLFTLSRADAAGETSEEPGPAYLAYAGPYSSSPSSAFGHLFLVLASRPDEAPPLWDVVTFNAVTFGVDPIRYLTVGISGGFLGRYSRLDFHEKTREYELLEDRDLWLIELKLTRAQRAALEKALEDTKGRWYPYTFFQKNCAHYLQLLLAATTGAIAEPAGFVSPTDVMDEVLRSELVGRSYYRPAASRRIASLGAEVDHAVTERLGKEDWTSLAADTAWIGALTVPGRRLALEFFVLKSLGASSPLPAGAQDGLARLRLLNAQEPREPRATPSLEGPGRPIPPPRFHRYSRVGLSHLTASSGPARLSLRYRGALHDELDPWFAHQPLNTMEFLAVESSSPQDRFAPRLEAAVLFSQRSLGASSWIKRRSSWLLEALARRGGLFGAEGMHFELRGGLGKTFRLPAELYAYGLATVAGVGRWGDGAALAPGLEAGLVALTADRWRYGVRWTLERDVFEWSRRHERLRAWARLDLARRWGATLTAERIPGGKAVALGVDWYP